MLVYSVDVSEADKRLKARDLLEKLNAEQSGALSVQSLSEFYRVATQRLALKLTSEEALIRVEDLAGTFPVFPVTRLAGLEACRLVDRMQLSIWDALIWSVAKLNEIPYVLTEDSAHNRVIEGVRYLNPFVAEFEETPLPGR